MPDHHKCGASRFVASTCMHPLLPLLAKLVLCGLKRTAEGIQVIEDEPLSLRKTGFGGRESSKRTQTPMHCSARTKAHMIGWHFARRVSAVLNERRAKHR